jgi:hypothetical protein
MENGTLFPVFPAKLAAEIAWTLAAAAGVVTVVSRWYAWQASEQFPPEKEQRRERHKAIWLKLKDSPWLQLPDIVIRWLVQARDSLGKLNVTAVMSVLLFISPFFVLFVWWIRADLPHAVSISHKMIFLFGAFLLYGACTDANASIATRLISAACLTGIAAGLCAFYTLDRGHLTAVGVFVVSFWVMVWHTWMYQKTPSGRALLPFVLGAGLIVCTQYPLFQILSSASLGWALLAALIASPFIGTGIWLALLLGLIPGVVRLLHYEKRQQFIRGFDLFAFSIGFSFFVSLLALFIGHQLDPQGLIPQTPRMLWSNALFDGATVVTSLYVLERAITTRRLLSISVNIPTAVVLDLALGMVFACGSLWFGIKGVAFKPVRWTLIGHSVDGTHWEFGPYFWAMHTTFLPLAFYLLVVLFSMCAKTFLARRIRFHGVAKELDGLAMTATFLGYIAAVLGLGGVLLGGAVLFKFIK